MVEILTIPEKERPVPIDVGDRIEIPDDGRLKVLEITGYFVQVDGAKEYVPSDKLPDDAHILSTVLEVVEERQDWMVVTHG